MGGLIGMWIGGPIGAAVASACEGSGAARVQHTALTKQAPDPMVVLSVGERRYFTPIAGNTYQPSWQTSFLVEELALREKPLRIEAVDVDDENANEPIGTDLLEPGLVLEKPITKRAFGQVEQLLLQATRVVELESPAVPHQPG